MGEETAPSQPKTAKQVESDPLFCHSFDILFQLEKEAKKAAEKAAKLEKLAAKQAKISAAKEAKAGGEDDKKEKKVKKEVGAVKEAAVYEGLKIRKNVFVLMTTYFRKYCTREYEGYEQSLAGRIQP